MLRIKTGKDRLNVNLNCNVLFLHILYDSIYMVNELLSTHLSVSIISKYIFVMLIQKKKTRCITVTNNIFSDILYRSVLYDILVIEKKKKNVVKF